MLNINGVACLRQLGLMHGGTEVGRCLQPPHLLSAFASNKAPGHPRPVAFARRKLSQEQRNVDAVAGGSEISGMILGTLMPCSSLSCVRPSSSQKKIEK